MRKICKVPRKTTWLQYVKLQSYVKRLEAKVLQKKAKKQQCVTQRVTPKRLKPRFLTLEQAKPNVFTENTRF